MCGYNKIGSWGVKRAASESRVDRNGVDTTLAPDEV